MKITRIEIEGFRKFRERTVFDLQDSLGRTLDLVVLAGPNGCGKTTVMDAVALALQPSYQLPCVRPDIALTVRDIVSWKCLKASIVLELEFTQAELDATKNLLDLAQKSWDRPVDRRLRLKWEFPDDRSVSGVGFTTYEPYSGRALLSARKLVTELLTLGIVTPDWFERCGGVFTFHQQRSAMQKTIPPSIARMLRPSHDFSSGEPFVTDDTCEILTTLAIKSKLNTRSNDKSKFDSIRDHFTRLCPPLQMDVVLNEYEEPSLEFTNGAGRFRYYGLSSGQQAVLAYVVELVDKRIHESVVMIDEVELHQEEIMQRKLLHGLQNLGHDNQLILSTHSSYLTDIVPYDSLIKMGYLTADESRVEDAVHA